MILEKDKILNQWVVWLKAKPSALVQVYKSKLKRDCEDFVKGYKYAK